MSCPVCFAPVEESVRTSMNAGILVLLGVTASVLVCLAAFFLSLVRRARTAGPAEAAHYSTSPSSTTPSISGCFVEEQRG